MVWNKVLYIIWTSLSPQSDNIVIEMALVTVCFAAISVLAHTHSAVTVCAVRVSILGRQMESWEISVENTFYNFLFLYQMLEKCISCFEDWNAQTKKKFRSKLTFNKNCLNIFMLHCLKLSTIYLFCKKNETIDMEADIWNTKFESFLRLYAKSQFQSATYALSSALQSIKSDRAAKSSGGNRKNTVDK